MKTRKLFTSAAVVALALPVFTLGQSSHVNAATTPAVTAVKTSYNAKTKSLTIAGKAKGASKVAVSYNAKALKPVKVTKKGNFKVVASAAGKKNSQASQFKIIGIGQATVTNY